MENRTKCTLECTEPELRIRSSFQLAMCTRMSLPIVVYIKLLVGAPRQLYKILNNSGRWSNNHLHKCVIILVGGHGQIYKNTQKILLGGLWKHTEYAIIPVDASGKIVQKTQLILWISYESKQNIQNWYYGTVCRYPERLPFPGTFAVTRNVCRYPEKFGGLISNL